jgi:predicted DNA-binding transcriptional regulator YafY
MSKRGYISRYLLLLKKLQQKPYASFKEIEEYLDYQFQFLQQRDDHLTIGFSQRTLQRDIKEIDVMFGITIEYSPRMKGYFIVQKSSENMNFTRMLEAFDMFQSLNLAQDLTPYVHLEKGKPQGTEHLYGLLHAIKNRYRVMFTYEKFYEEEFSQRHTEPLALKEYRNRWYLLAKDCGDGSIKTFALDRISMLQISNHIFVVPEGHNVEEYFTFCFGIERPNNGKPEEILLSLSTHQAKYIKTLPLHYTQEIVMENEDEVRVKLEVFPTHDLYMEIMSLGEQVKVLKPKSLARKVAEGHKTAWMKYEKA